MFPEERIVRIPPERVPSGFVAEKSLEFFKHWELDDLRGQRPESHPLIRRGPYGEPILEINQVWVEILYDLLWVVKKIEKCRTYGPYRHEVWLCPYKSTGDYCLRKLSEQTLRECMEVWDEAVELNQKIP